MVVEIRSIYYKGVECWSNERNVLYHVSVVSVVHICQNSLKCVFQIGEFYHIQIIAQ